MNEVNECQHRNERNKKTNKHFNSIQQLLIQLLIPITQVSYQYGLKSYKTTQRHKCKRLPR